MTQHTITERKCDECGKIHSVPEMMFGPPAFLGWIQARCSNDGVLDDAEQNLKDLCGNACALAYFEKRKAAEKR